MRVYVVTMYRWGDQQNHSYVLGVWSNKTVAQAYGEMEGSCRGGKYEPKITEWGVDANECDNLDS